MEDYDSITSMQSWKRNALIIGAVVGGLVGLGGAYLFTQKAEDPEHLPSITTGDAVRLGVLVLGLLRSIADLG